jgi:hypothetical protein
MADIFSKVANIVGSTLKQVATPDTVRDYAHASKLFVGSNFRLVPKNGFLFHVFFDISAVVNQVYSVDPANPNKDRELGLMVKSVDLPRFTMETKTYNAYNRSNIVQSKVRYDSVNIVFHDDSANLIRRFWENYFTYYYRDTQSDIYIESGLADLTIPHKYGSYTNRRYTDFGFTPKSSEPYLRSIRIYSLHQQSFSEYVLVNPIIKTFRHGQHLQGESVTLAHEMQIEYEGVLYSTGRTTQAEDGEGIREFAELHYDKTPSPITAGGGGPKSIFGVGGLINSGRDILKDVQDGNLGLAAFKAARAFKAAKGMNLKNAAISELSGYFNETLQDTAGKILVPTLKGEKGLVQSITEQASGIDKTQSLLLLAGAASTLVSSSKPKPIASNTRINEVNQATTVGVGAPVSNYKPSFPAIPNAPTAATNPATATLLNQLPATGTTGQLTINSEQLLQVLNQQIDSLIKVSAQTSAAMATADQQVKTANTVISLLNAKLAQVQALPDSEPAKQTLIDQYNNSIAVQQNIRDTNQSVLETKTAELTQVTQQLGALRTERDLIQ